MASPEASRKRERGGKRPQATAALRPVRGLDGAGDLRLSGAGSIYDGEEDDASPWFLPPMEDGVEDLAATPKVGASEIAARVVAEEGKNAERLYQAGVRLGRFDRAVAEGGPLERLRVVEVSDLMWRNGMAVRPERLALFELDGVAERDRESEDYALASWALRRLRAATAPEEIDGLRVWLDRWVREGDHGQRDKFITRHDPDAVEIALERWLKLQGALAPASAPIRAAVLANVWAATTAFGRERRLTAAMLGAVLTAADLSVPFTPVAISAALWRALRMADPVAAIAPWLQAVREGAERGFSDLARLADWRERAESVTSAMQAKGPGKAAALLGDHLALSVRAAADETGFSQPAMLSAMSVLEREGLAREITKARRFRHWTAAI